MSSHEVSEHPWLPRASCGAHCITVDASASRRSVVAVRTTARIACAVLLLLSAVPLLADRKSVV